MPPSVVGNDNPAYNAMAPVVGSKAKKKKVTIWTTQAWHERAQPGVRTALAEPP